MAFYHSKGFKYLKNLIIGVGAALVMVGALYKIQSWEMPTIGGIKVDMLSVGLITEAILFLMLGLLPPEKSYYWEKLYPGLDNSGGASMALTPSGGKPINGEVMERQFDGMLGELRDMSKSLGSLKALQEVDFSQTKDQMKTMGDFYGKLNEAMADMANASADVKAYRERVATLNGSMEKLNGNMAQLGDVYGNVLSAFNKG